MNETTKIQTRLEHSDRKHQKQAGTRFLLQSIKYVCLFVLIIFALDMIFHLYAGWRLILILILFTGVLLNATYCWYLGFVRRNRLEFIARILESRDPKLGSRLINLLQLSGQAEDKSLSPLTRKLATEAVENYDVQLNTIPFEELAKTGELRHHLKHAAFALIGFIVLLIVFFPVTKIETVRFFDPYGDHPPYSFTQLEIVEPSKEGTNVIYGKGLVVRVKASGHQPKEVFLTAYPLGQPEKALMLPMFDKGKVGYDQLLDNIRTELLVFAHTKNRESISKQVRISVILTPQLERAFVRVVPPTYTGLKAEEKQYTFKNLQALYGSVMQFRLQSNRPLREGILEIASGEHPPQRVTMKKSANNEVSTSIVLRGSGRLRFSFMDINGIPSERPLEGSFTVTHDLPPEIRIADPQSDAFVSMDFKLKAQIEANDDYGLKTIRLHRGLNGVYSPPRLASYETVIRDSDQTVDFNFDDLGIEPGDIVSFFAEAVDSAPEPHMARSETIRLLVISVEEYNDLLREKSDIADAEAKYSALMDELQQLIEQQKEISEEIKKLHEKLGRTDPKQREQLVEEFNSLIAKQNELNQKLNQHSDRMDHFVRKKPLYDVEKDLQEFLNERADRIRQSTRANNDETHKITEQTSPSGSPNLSSENIQNFIKAADDQLKRLNQEQESTNRKVVQPLKDITPMQELIKDFNQFEALYRTQQELVAQARAYNRAGQLSREDQLALKELAATEKQVGDWLKNLEDKLRSDAKKAEKNFPKAANSGRELADRMADLRLRNLAMQTTNQMLAGKGESSFQLADRLRKEMEKLFGECQGGSCPNGNELDAYLRLLRMNAGNTFNQMARSRKFGMAGGSDSGLGEGEGMLGTSGYAVPGNQQVSVLGNETSPTQNVTAKQGKEDGYGKGSLAEAKSGSTEKPDMMKRLNPINRQSGSVASESVIEEYKDVVDSYFKAITTKKKTKKKE